MSSRPMSRKRVGAVALALFSVALIVPTSVFAQDERDGSEDGSRLEEAIAKTDQVIERASELVSESNNERARMALRAAGNYQAKSKEAAVGGRFEMAIRLTLEARNLAQKAAHLAQGDDGADLDRLQALIDRADRAIDRAADVVRDCDSERAQKLLATAIELQAKAKTQLAQGNFRQALRLSQEAIERARKAASSCRSDDASGDRVEHALDRTDALIDRAGGVGEESGNDRAMAKFRLAVSQQTEARKHFVDGNEKAAMRLTLAARDTITLALRLANHATDPTDPEDA